MCRWHEDNWDNEESRFVAYSLHGGGSGDLYIAFNAHHFAVKVSPTQSAVTAVNCIRIG
jgi:hypothetical protein